MSHIELDDQILNHDKFIRVGKSCGGDAIWLWLGLRAYCSQRLSDGFVPEDMLDEVRGPKDPKVRAKCLRALIDIRLVDKCDGGVMLHDYLDWSPSRDQVLVWKATSKIRASLRSNPALMKLVRERDGGRCRYCGVDVNWAIRKGNNSGTYDHVDPVSLGGDNSLDNVVTCCRSCNSKKGNRSLSECGMRLLPVGQPTTTGSVPVEKSETTGLTHARTHAPALEGEVEEEDQISQGGAGGNRRNHVQRCEEGFMFTCPATVEFTEKNKTRAARCARPIADLYELFRAKRIREKAKYGDTDAVTSDFDVWLLNYATNHAGDGPTKQMHQPPQPNNTANPYPLRVE